MTQDEREEEENCINPCASHSFFSFSYVALPIATFAVTVTLLPVVN